MLCQPTIWQEQLNLLVRCCVLRSRNVEVDDKAMDSWTYLTIFDFTTAKDMLNMFFFHCFPTKSWGGHRLSTGPRPRKLRQSRWPGRQPRHRPSPVVFSAAQALGNGWSSCITAKKPEKSIQWFNVIYDVWHCMNYVFWDLTLDAISETVSLMYISICNMQFVVLWNGSCRPSDSGLLWIRIGLLIPSICGLSYIHTWNFHVRKFYTVRNN